MEQPSERQSPAVEPRAEPIGDLGGELGGELAFVRALARELVYDEHEAEDVAQDALLAGLSHAPRDTVSLRAWLARVVRNASIDRVRRRAHRRRLERDAARDERLPSTAELLERDATRNALLRALRALDEPYRTVLRLRFLDGLAPREVARTLGVPVETVRTRIKRGLERLRAALDRGTDGRGAWLVALAGWLEAPMPRAPLRRLGARGVVAAAVLVGVTLFVLVLQLQRGDGSSSVAAAPSQDLESSGARALALGGEAGNERAARGPERAGERGADAAVSGARAAGRVLLDADRGAAFAELVVWQGDAGRVVDGRFDGAVLRRAADARGEFEIDGLPHEFVLFAHADGYGSANCVVVRAAAAKRYDALELELVALGEVTGRVFDAARAPRDFAELEFRATATRVGVHPTGRRDCALAPALAFATRTDAIGRFAIPWIVPGRYAVSVDGRVLPNEVEILAGALELELELVDLPGAPKEYAKDWSLAGRVLEADTGRALDAFDLCVLDRFGATYAATRGAAGDFELRARTEGDAWLWIGAASHAHRLVRLDAALARDATFALRPERTLALRVVDAHGAPVAGASVAFADPDGEPRLVPVGGRRWANVVRTDVGGRVDALALPTGELRIAVTAHGTASVQLFDLDLATGADAERTLTLSGTERELEFDDGRELPTGELAFTALDARGVACAELRGTFVGEHFRPREAGVHRELELAADGATGAVRDLIPADACVTEPEPRLARLVLPAHAVAVEVRGERGVNLVAELPAGRDSARVRLLPSPRWNSDAPTR